MRLSPQSLSASGDSPWIIPPPRLMTPTIGLAVTFSSNAVLTGASVYYTYDDPAQTPQAAVLAWAANVLTVTLPTPHGLNVGDTSDVLESASGAFTGNIDVGTVISQTSFSGTWTGAGLPANDTALARIYKLFQHPTLKNLTTRLDGVLSASVGAFRLTAVALSAGYVTLTSQVGDNR
jgi:hypothetical protein